MTTKAEETLKGHRFDQVYFFLGVNNLTVKHTSGRVTAVFDNQANLVETMEQKMDIARQKLSKYTPKFISCHIIGIDISTYNKSPDECEYQCMQEVINNGLPILNAAIDAQNMQAKVIGPWLCDTIHANINGRLVHKYKRLPDGVHPDELTRKLWAKKFIKAFKDNRCEG